MAATVLFFFESTPEKKKNNIFPGGEISFDASPFGSRFYQDPRPVICFSNTPTYTTWGSF